MQKLVSIFFNVQHHLQQYAQQRLLRQHQRIKAQRESGFTIVEIAVTIPVIALLSVTVMSFMVSSIILVNDNELKLEAAENVQHVMDTAANATTCPQLEALGESGSIGNTVFNETENDEYSLVTEVRFEANPLEGMDEKHFEYSDWETCNNAGGIAVIETTATGNDGVLYRSTRNVQLTGGLALM